MKKKNTTRRLKRLTLKILWFGTVLMLATIAWFALYVSLVLLTGTTGSSTIGPIALTAFSVLAFIVTSWLVFRKHKVTLLRWTAKTLLILSPFMLACSLFLAVLDTAMTWLPATKAPTQQEAVDTSNTSNNAPTSPQSGSQTGSSCFEQQIPYRTTYQNSSIYKKGEQHVAFAGTNGKQRVCITNGTTTTTTIMQPSDEIIYVGSREDSTGSSSSNVTAPPARQYQPPPTSHTNPDDCHIADFFCD